MEYCHEKEQDQKLEHEQQWQCQISFEAVPANIQLALSSALILRTQVKTRNRDRW